MTTVTYISPQMGVKTCVEFHNPGHNQPNKIYYAEKILNYQIDGKYTKVKEEYIIDANTQRKVRMHENTTTTEWYYKNKLHRDGDLPAVVVVRGKNVVLQQWYINGKKHRVNGPAIIYDDGYKQREEWFFRNKPHRYDGPSLTLTVNKFLQQSWYIHGLPRPHDCTELEISNKRIVRQWFDSDHKLSRSDGPAYIEEDIGGENVKLSEGYYYAGKMHRVDGPARTYSVNGVLLSYEWRLYGILHNSNGCAFSYRNMTKRWYEYGIPHRLTGPARIEIDNDKVVQDHYYVMGKEYNKMEYMKLTNNYSMVLCDIVE